MKKINLILQGTVLIILLPVISLSSDTTSGMNMDSYSIWAGYALFILIGLGFYYFLKYTSNEPPPVTYENKTNPAEKIITSRVNASAEISQLLKFSSYLIISGLVLYSVIIVILLM